MKNASHSISWLLRKSRYDKTTQLPRTQERRREGVFYCLAMEEMVGLYSSGWENMNRMPFNDS